MSVDFGPLTALIGTWKGDSGSDLAPEPDGSETTPYSETLVIEPVGDVTNAEEQTLVVLQYEMVVRRGDDGSVFHHQIGYWTWDSEAGTVCNSFNIPRRVAVLAGGTVHQNGDKLTFQVAAEKGSSEWGIAESGFMDKRASTTGFSQILTVEGDTMHYEQTTLVDIYGRKQFEHTDSNTLKRVSV